MATNYGYVLYPDGSSLPISDPNAVQRGEAVALAVNSENLGGLPASDYLLAANAAQLTGIKMELLWENASPTSAFAAQLVSCDLTDVGIVLIELRPNAPSTVTFFAVCSLGGKTYPQYLYSSYFVQRSTSVDASGVTFGDGESINYGSSISQSNSRAVPTKIWAIKGGEQ